MKFFAPALIFCGAAAFGQSPQVPHKMQFAGMTLTVRDDARREIQKDVDALTQSPRHFNIKVERAKTYFPIIEKIFAEERLPDDFKYLSLQESALIPDAVSTSNAVGFWQFLDIAGKDFGLRMDNEVDERMNIVSASHAAAQYLKKSNHYFNNWIYALQSYQMGAGGVMRVVGDKDLGGRHMEITSDTYWYVKRFLAHKVAFENSVGGKGQLEMVQYPDARGKTTADIAREISIDESRLREFNKWLKGYRVPEDKEYAFLIPKGEAGVEFGVLAMNSSRPKTTEPSKSVQEDLKINGVLVIRAAKGESLQALASRSNLSLKKFLRVNDMSIDQPVVAGQLYFVEKKKKKASQELYTLQPGENLWMISQRFGVQKKSILKFNQLTTDKPIPGSTLYLSTKKDGAMEEYEGPVVLLDENEAFNWDPRNPREKKSVSDGSVRKTELKSIDQMENRTAGAMKVHEVTSSDTLYSVARQYGVTIKELMDWNDKKDFTLSVGEKLKVHSH